MDGGKAVLHSSDLPYEYIYDDEKHVSNMPDSKLSVRNILESAYASAEDKMITKKLSRCIPPYPHAVRVKNGVRVYEYSETRKQSYKSSLWKEAYNILHQRLDIAEPIAAKAHVRTQIHPCLHRIAGLLDPETCIKCPRCHKSILSTKVLKS
ncbi:uncharacterized protein LOC6613278 [Drosophila sechellia]|uniref:GM18120 n=1 Tax=Drosophila sechellia TaxID=7238 RepID=B4I328_DROSE|nr:uncharacterized protein LOC6613278 [Drosophila sechellia]EDW54173.1 GM18120 [Drosophila sechellia]